MKKNILVAMVAMGAMIASTTQAHASCGMGVTSDLSEILIYALEHKDDVKEKTTVKINENDVDLLAHLMTAEQGYGASETAYYYTGSVVLNRVSSDDFPDTLEGVIYQKGQYACTWDGNITKEPDEVTMEIAEDLLVNGSVLPENVVFQAEFRQGSGTYAILGNTYFCYK